MKLNGCKKNSDGIICFNGVKWKGPSNMVGNPKYMSHEKRPRGSQKLAADFYSGCFSAMQGR